MLIGVNGIELFYEKTGEGRPLIMVHGNSEDHTIFDEAVEVLKEQFTCYTIDSRGHGQSSPCKELHYKDMAQDMIAFMTELDLDNVAFYGFSDGGIVGLLVAMSCSRVTNLIVSGANITPKGTKWWFRVFLKGMSIRKKDQSENTGHCGQQGPDQGRGDEGDRGCDPGSAPHDPEGREARQLCCAQH